VKAKNDFTDSNTSTRKVSFSMRSLHFWLKWRTNSFTYYHFIVSSLRCSKLGMEEIFSK